MKWNLGYYDYDKGNKGKKGGHFLSGLGGAIVGGLIVTLALPTLFQITDCCRIQCSLKRKFRFRKIIILGI